ISEEVVSEFVEEKSLIPDSEDEPWPRTAKDASHILDPSLFTSKDPEIDKSISEDKKKAEEILEIGKPLPFSKKEKSSSAEWPQLTSKQPIKREAKTENIQAPDRTVPPKTPQRKVDQKIKKFQLIDEFIKSNPKIVPTENSSKIAIKDSSTFDKNELMTVTLAKVYLEQKKYKKAIQAYRILSLNYPEKSSFFEDRIKAVEKLQQENT